MEERNLRYEKRLRALTIENGAIAEIEFLKAEPSPKADGGEPLYPLPERCEVTYRLYPTEQSEITCVIVLPLTGWNKKFLGTGNGGQAGVIVRQSLNAGVSRGFATANTDMGSSTDSKKMYRCPERWTDFAHRATHLMTVVGKRICEAFYGEAPQRAYFTGGSTGGQQALKEAQRAALSRGLRRHRRILPRPQPLLFTAVLPLVHQGDLFRSRGRLYPRADRGSPFLHRGTLCGCFGQRKGTGFCPIPAR